MSEQPVRHNPKMWIGIVTLVGYFCTDDDDDDDDASDDDDNINGIVQNVHNINK
jgi:hypothetical protein